MSKFILNFDNKEHSYKLSKLPINESIQSIDIVLDLCRTLAQETDAGESQLHINNIQDGSISMVIDGKQDFIDIFKEHFDIIKNNSIYSLPSHIIKKWMPILKKIHDKQLQFEYVLDDIKASINYEDIKFITGDIIEYISETGYISEISKNKRDGLKVGILKHDGSKIIFSIDTKQIDEFNDLKNNFGKLVAVSLKYKQNLKTFKEEYQFLSHQIRDMDENLDIQEWIKKLDTIEGCQIREDAVENSRRDIE